SPRLDVQHTAAALGGGPSSHPGRSTPGCDHAASGGGCRVGPVNAGLGAPKDKVSPGVSLLLPRCNCSMVASQITHAAGTPLGRPALPTPTNAWPLPCARDRLLASRNGKRPLYRLSDGWYTELSQVRFRWSRKTSRKSGPPRVC